VDKDSNTPNPLKTKQQKTARERTLANGRFFLKQPRPYHRLLRLANGFLRLYEFTSFDTDMLGGLPEGHL
jgi:hypothetical protein